MRCQCAEAFGEMVGGRSLVMALRDAFRITEYIDSMFRRLVRQYLSPAAHRLLGHIPSQCSICRTWPSNGLVCEPCITRFAQPLARCTGCALALPALTLLKKPHLQRCGACLTQPPPLDNCLAAVSYAYPWNTCITSYKFGSNPAWASTFSLLLKSTPWVEPAIDHADVLIPVPLSTERLRERGFNQALQLCKHLSPEKTEAQLLLRVKNTLTQSSLTRSERLKNVATAFAVEPLLTQHLQGKRVVLVDDVMTSGATLFAAAKALRLAQVSHITAIVFARTEAV
jgi:ComF family protein